MQLLTVIRTYLSELGERPIRLLAAGLLPIFLSLAFVLLARSAPEGFAYGEAWLSRSFAFWVDSIGVSILLLLSGVAILDYAEKHDAKE